MSQALIDEVLEEYGALTRAAMQPYLRPGQPAEYLYSLMADYPGRGGKMIRPAILMATASAFGVPAKDAAELCASLELLHNALLIHDDIEDGSEVRRGKPALHQSVGLELAINTGDALALTSLRPLTDALPRFGPSIANALTDEMHRMARETAEGQAMELGWRRDQTTALAPEDYLVMVMKKTCWLATIYPCRAGATLGWRQAPPPAAFVNFGFFFGAAFQIYDDILNIEADDRYGKEIGGDIAEGKRTLMLIDMFHRLDDAKRGRLMDLLAAPRAEQDKQDLIWATRKMKDLGSLDRARTAARGLVGAACHEFEIAFARAPESRDKAFLRALAPWTMTRTF